MPPIRSRRPMWDLAQAGTPDKAASTTSKKTLKKADAAFDKAVVGVWVFIASEAAFFVILLITYVFFNATTAASAAHLDVKTTGIFSICLFASSFTIYMSEKSLASGRESAFRGWLLATIVLGAIFMAGQANEYTKLFASGLNVNSSLFASTFFTLTGFHGLHVTLGLLALGILFAIALAGDFKGMKHSPAFKAISLYWHFVDVVWIAVFSIVYLRNLL